MKRNDRRSLHIVYEHGAYGFGLLFDARGVLLGALTPEEVEGEKRLRSGPLILDPKRRASFAQPGAAEAVDRFSRYFTRVFREGSPISGSFRALGDRLAPLIRETDLKGPLLDLGAGAGDYAACLSSTPVQVDISLPRRNRAEARPGLVCASGAELPFPDGAFGGVLCLFVLEHVARPLKVVAEIVRVLRRGGTALLAVPSVRPLELATWIVPGLRPTLPLHHVRTFGPLRRGAVESTEGLLSALSAAGCRSVSLAPLTSNGNGVPRTRRANGWTRSLCFGAQTAILARR